jgi:hypothetical protein
MDVSEPHMRRRGFFLHSDTTGEPDTGERESPEGLAIRIGFPRRSTTRHIAISSTALTHVLLAEGRSRAPADLADEGLPEIRSGSATGSRQRARTLR